MGAEVNLQDNEGITALMIAVGQSDSEAVDVLIGHGADINMQESCGRTALFLSETTCMRQLLECGAIVDMQDNNKTTALMTACQQNSPASKLNITLLLEFGAQVDMQDHEGETALMKACVHKHYGCIEPLMIAGADMNMQTKMGLNSFNDCYY